MAASMSYSHTSMSLSIDQHLGLVDPLTQAAIAQLLLLQQIYAAAEELLKSELEREIRVRIPERICIVNVNDEVNVAALLEVLPQDRAEGSAPSASGRAVAGYPCAVR
jgi:hypothetical protein